MTKLHTIRDLDADTTFLSVDEPDLLSVVDFTRYEGPVFVVECALVITDLGARSMMITASAGESDRVVSHWSTEVEARAAAESYLTAEGDDETREGDAMIRRVAGYEWSRRTATVTCAA